MSLLLPILLPIAGGLLILREKTPKKRNMLTMGTIALSVAVALVLCAVPTGDFTLLPIWGELTLMLRIDNLSRFFMVLVGCIWLPVGWFSLPYSAYAGGENKLLGVYTMTLGALFGLAMAANFITFYMFFEVMTLMTVPLVLHNNTVSARRASFQYLGYSVFGAGIALAGYFFVYYYLTTSSFTPGGALSPFAVHHPQLLALAYTAMVVGFGAKAGLMPMQSWLPSAHPEAPAPASAVLSGLITKAGVLAIIRITYYMFGTAFLVDTWAQKLLLGLTLVTVFSGSMLAFREKLLKRRLAYSTISQVSYVLFGVLLMSREGLIAALLQMVFHAIAKNALFLTAGAMIFSTHHVQVEQMVGIGRRMPITTKWFTVASLSLIGIPPMAGAVSKWYLLSAGLDTAPNGFGVAGLVVLILSALLTAGYLLPITTRGFFPGVDYIAEYKEVSPNMTRPVAILAIALVLLGLFPLPLLHFVTQLATLVTM